MLLYIERVDFYPSITKNLLKKVKNFAEAHILLLDDDKQRLAKLGLRETVGYLLSQWECMIVRMFASYLEIIYFRHYQNYIRKRHCIETTDWRFLRIKINQNQKN